MKNEEMTTVFTIDETEVKKGRKPLTDAEKESKKQKKEEQKKQLEQERERKAKLLLNDATVFELIDRLKSVVEYSTHLLTAEDVINLNDEIDEITKLKNVIKEEQKKVIQREIERKEKELEALKQSLL